MSKPGNEIDSDELVQFSASQGELRLVSETLLPASREETATYVENVLSTESEGLHRCCVEYFTNTLPNGEAAYADLLTLATETNTAIEDLITGIATVQSVLLVEESQTDTEPHDGATGALARVVTQDSAALTARKHQTDRSETKSTKATRQSARATSSRSVDAILDRAEEIESSTFEIETLIEQLAENTDNLVGEVQEINSATEKIASTTDEVNEQSDDAQSLAQEGCQRAEEMTSRMDRINENAAEVRTQVDSLQEQTDKIDEIVDVINDIADQTNMLALNASIEAARAGGGSEGFAVVADEVKALAEESKDQVTEIEELVGGIQSGTEEAAEELDELEDETEDGLKASELALETFGEIEQLVTDVSTALDEVQTATEEQSESTEMLAMMIDEASRKATRISDEITQIAESNETQREELKSFAESLD